MSAGIATRRPKAVVISASEIPADTDARPPEPEVAISWKAVMMPSTVPSSPTKGADDATVAHFRGVLPPLILRAREAEEALGHDAQRIDGHDREGDDHQTGRKAHRLPHPNETEIHGG